MTNDNRRANTKKAIQEAMVTLLKTESFDDITTIKISKEAGISRSSFYTHYKDKFELIDSCQRTLFNQVEYIFEKHEGNKKQAFLEIFEFLKREQLLSALISANGTREFQAFIVNKVRIFINTDFQNRFGREELSPVEKEYSSIYFAYAFFGLCQSWIANGKKESPRQMTNLILKLLPLSL
ncbi:TetR/AcrR family transcriptional regulator [Streptococcus pasteurianus]|uniref:TetR family transcriptional regulator n=5 Tax=Streptococcus TaxID=1301 RepID=F5X3W9_STRPX|nr:MULTISPECIES: TetR/AcrR family transcriptional regulator [Streptococcus]MBS5218930.1 TetR/AcrR family transcriptional regulator C-terminal domain-containing protein [Streptococcus sp.]MCH1617241.1 TetR/AcrR family transcriptional regulator C-terminal domain-containing protein [Streptococcus gallolyticus]MCI7516938.1 TetR/AcrR family transcriptional regulator C-terminal domain-containing protein [Streptococcus sp.]MCO7182728.1 TetR/AcrR family transcriptional regulator C-terminal domain-conta